MKKVVEGFTEVRHMKTDCYWLSNLSTAELMLDRWTSTSMDFVGLLALFFIKNIN